jgi:hypothetical protein
MDKITKDLEYHSIDEIKILEELKKLSEEQKEQYLSRLKRWDSYLETRLGIEKSKTIDLIVKTYSLVDATNQMLEKIKSNPKYEKDFEEKFIDIEIEIKECVQAFGLEVEKFFSLFDNKKVRIFGNFSLKN